MNNNFEKKIKLFKWKYYDYYTIDLRWQMHRVEFEFFLILSQFKFLFLNKLRSSLHYYFFITKRRYFCHLTWYSIVFFFISFSLFLSCLLSQFQFLHTNKKIIKHANSFQTFPGKFSVILEIQKNKNFWNSFLSHSILPTNEFYLYFNKRRFMKWKSKFIIIENLVIIYTNIHWIICHTYKDINYIK